MNTTWWWRTRSAATEALQVTPETSTPATVKSSLTGSMHPCSFYGFLRWSSTLPNIQVNQEAFLNGLNVHQGVIYLFASGSTLRLPVGQPIYYSDISSRYMADQSMEKITLEADHLSYRFPGGVTRTQQVSFSAQQGNLVGIMGSSGSGKTTLLNVLVRHV